MVSSRAKNGFKYVSWLPPRRDIELTKPWNVPCVSVVPDDLATIVDPDGPNQQNVNNRGNPNQSIFG
jgi:hypothetical protein